MQFARSFFRKVLVKTVQAGVVPVSIDGLSFGQIVDKDYPFAVPEDRDHDFAHRRDGLGFQWGFFSKSHPIALISPLFRGCSMGYKFRLCSQDVRNCHRLTSFCVLHDYAKKRG